MKKPSSPVQTEKRAKRTPEEKAAHKSAKKAGRVSADLNDDRATKKASQKKSLKSAAKQLQKELNNRMSEVVTRIRKETKAKLKEVVKEATRRLDVDMERMFEEALHTIVRHYDSAAEIPVTADQGDKKDIAAMAKNQRGPKQGLTLNKDGTPRKSRTAQAGEKAAAVPATAAKTKPAATTRTAKPAPTGARRGPKPRNQPTAAVDAADVLHSDQSSSNGRAGE